jgi:DNA-directed RNA polymerase subunit B'
MQQKQSSKSEESADIYFNGKYIGQTPTPDEFTDNIKKKRRMGLISEQINIAYYSEFNEVRALTENGRVRRPLIIIENGKSKLTQPIADRLSKGQMTWGDLVRQGVIEYLDAMEEEKSFIAIDEKSVTKDHTHMEIDPSAILGVSASMIPYPEYNRGDRINYGAKMVGQSIGLPATNFLLRMDTKFNSLASPQIPMVGTQLCDMLNNYPEGQNIILAVMCYDGYNMNDAVVLNKSSIERGLFRSFYYRTYETIRKRYWGGQEDEIMIPEPGIKGHRGEDAYKNLDADGIINPETYVESDSVLVGKVSPLRFLSGEEFASDIENKRDNSVVIRHGEKGIIDKVVISETTDANQMFKMRVRDYRIPELGDKFASRHGQKGVVGLVTPQEDMPFTSLGVTPDIIFNPHAIPSRMTIGHLLEMLAGKAGAMAGRTMDGTAFTHMKEDEIRKMMFSIGFREDGKETLYDGRTGKKYDVMIYVGSTYYMKLDHMVADKIHARSRGPVTLLTKQPTEGRAKRGGLRLGEMEQQCLVGHGAALTLKERFDSDKTSIPICNKCGLVAIFDVTKNRGYCPICKESEIVWVETSYAFKLTIDEFKAMGVYPKINTEEI